MGRKIYRQRSIPTHFEDGLFASVILDDEAQELDAVLVRREGAQELLRRGLEVEDVLGDDPCGRHGTGAAAVPPAASIEGGGAARGSATLQRSNNLMRDVLVAVAGQRYGA